MFSSMYSDNPWLVINAQTWQKIAFRNYVDVASIFSSLVLDVKSILEETRVGWAHVVRARLEEIRGGFLKKELRARTRRRGWKRTPRLQK